MGVLSERSEKCCWSQNRNVETSEFLNPECDYRIILSLAFTKSNDWRNLWVCWRNMVDIWHWFNFRTFMLLSLESAFLGCSSWWLLGTSLSLWLLCFSLVGPRSWRGENLYKWAMQGTWDEKMILKKLNPPSLPSSFLGWNRCQKSPHKFAKSGHCRILRKSHFTVWNGPKNGQNG